MRLEGAAANREGAIYQNVPEEFHLDRMEPELVGNYPVVWATFFDEAYSGRYAKGVPPKRQCQDVCRRWNVLKDMLS